MSISIPLHVPWLFSDGKEKNWIESVWIEFLLEDEKEIKIDNFNSQRICLQYFFLDSSRFELIDCGLSPLVCVIQFLFFIYLRLLFLISILHFNLTFGVRHLVFRALHRALFGEYYFIYSTLFFLFFFWFNRLHENKISFCASQGYSIFNLLNYSMIQKHFFFFNLKTLNWIQKIPMKLKLISFLHWFGFSQSYFPQRKHRLPHPRTTGCSMFNHYWIFWFSSHVPFIFQSPSHRRKILNFHDLFWIAFIKAGLLPRATQFISS